MHFAACNSGMAVETGLKRKGSLLLAQCLFNVTNPAYVYARFLPEVLQQQSSGCVSVLLES